MTRPLAAISENTVAVPKAVRVVAPQARGRLRGWLRANRVFAACLAIAVALHLPTMPFSRFLAGVFDFWGDDETDEEDGEAIVPIEIDMEATSVDQDKPNPDATTKPPPPSQPTAAAPPEPGPPPAPTSAPAPPPPSDTPKKEPAVKSSPVEEIEDIKALVKADNNVSIVLIGSKLRTHPVGSKLGVILNSNAQWEPFFKGSGLDPVNDVDVMILTGPRMRISGQVVAIVKFGADMTQVKAAVQHVIDSGDVKGEWIKDAPVLAARATADGAERIFAIVPEKNLLYVIPSPYPSPKQQLRLQKRKRLEKALAEAKKKVFDQLERVKAGTFKDFSEANYAIDAFMVEPWKLMGKDGKVDIPIVGGIELIPKTLLTGRAVVVPRGAEADVTITMSSSSDQQAVKDAEDLNGSWSAIQIGASFKYKLDLPDVKFKPEGSKIVGKGTLTKAALEVVLGIAKEKTEEAKAEKKKKDAEKAQKELEDL